MLPGLLVLAAGLAIAGIDGGFEPTVWYPTALFLLALLASVVVAAPPTLADRSRLVEVALGCFAALTVWALLSILWADAPGTAWTGGNRMLLYLIALGIICLRPWSARDGLIALGMVALVTTGMAVSLVIEAVTAADPSDLFVQGRLASPIGYLNASASLWLIGFFPAIHLAISSKLPWPVRGLGLSGATVLLEMALLSQSRGAAIAIAFTVVVYLAFTSRRVPAVLALLAVVGLTALVGDTLLDIRRSTGVSGLGPGIDASARAVAISASVAFVLGCAGALLGRRLRPEVERRPQLRRIGDLGLAAVAVCVALAGLVAIGNPATWVDARWDDFKSSGYSVVDTSSTRFAGSLGSGRYDFYRVALNEYREHPVIGIGADNFGAEYLRQRRTGEAPRYPHSVVLMVLSQLGTVGAALLAAFIALMVAAAVRVRRRAGGEHGAVIAAAFATGVVWLIHSVGDWLWEFPALGLLGLCMLAVAARSRDSASMESTQADEDERPESAKSRGPLVGSLAARIAMAVVALAAATSLSVPGVAARYLSRAYSDAPAQPSSALERLERAAEINPLDSEALVAKGVVAQRIGRNRVAIDAFRRAIERDPENWFAHLEIGLVLALDGRPKEAERSVREALALNPDQPITREVLKTVRRGEALSANAVERRLNAVLERRFNVTDPEATGAAGTNGG